MINPDVDHLKAKIFFCLKSLSAQGETLNSRLLELAICESFGFQHVGDSNYYADGVTADKQLSVKTRIIQPEILKTKEGRDFQSHPTKFLGPKCNHKQNRLTNGIEIVQRRQQLDLTNDSTADPVIVGEQTIEGFNRNIFESQQKYQTARTYEAISVHGYDRTEKYYLFNLYWKEAELLDPATITWKREGSSVCGYVLVDNVLKKVCERVNGNSKREATCFKEYKDLCKYQHSISIKVPLPDLWTFDKETILNEINLKEQQCNHITSTAILEFSTPTV
jgi:hypothetical protein